MGAPVCAGGRVNYRESPTTVRRCVADLVALTALPVLWAHQDADSVAEDLTEVLARTLRLDMAYISIIRASLGSTAEAAWINRGLGSAAAAQYLGHTLVNYLRDDLTDMPGALLGSAWTGRLRLMSRPLGVAGEFGMAVAGSQRSDFPTDLERLQFRVIVNQAVIAFRSTAPRERSAVKANTPALMPIAFESCMSPVELKTCLKQLGLSQQKFSRQVYVSGAAVKNWAQGRSKIPGPVVLLIRLMLESQRVPSSFNRLL